MLTFLLVVFIYSILSIPVNLFSIFAINFLYVRLKEIDYEQPMFKFGVFDAAEIEDFMNSGPLEATFFLWPVTLTIFIFMVFMFLILILFTYIINPYFCSFFNRVCANTLDLVKCIRIEPRSEDK